METDSTQTCFTLRNLPFPAKLVVTVFLLSVGLGYLSAMIQLHFRHASRGSAFPTVDDVVARFSGQVPPWNPKPPKPEAPAPVAPAPEAEKLVKIKVHTIITDRCVACHGPDGGEQPELDSWDKLSKFLEPDAKSSAIHKLLTADEDAEFGKGSSMRQAFHKKGFIDNVPWEKVVKKGKITPEELERIKKERELERLGLVAWVEAGAPKEAYDKNTFSPAPEQKPQENPNDPVVKAQRRQMSVVDLTQSTHAHLLSFAMLWALTGLIFAFSSYPMWIRIGLAPIVLVAQVADICCWWLARLPECGPYFAAAIMGTGAIVGLGLMAQIVLSLFNLYNGKGKVLVALLFIGAGIGMAVMAPRVMNEVNAEKPAG